MPPKDDRGATSAKTAGASDAQAPRDAGAPPLVTRRQSQQLWLHRTADEEAADEEEAEAAEAEAAEAGTGAGVFSLLA